MNIEERLHSISELSDENLKNQIKIEKKNVENAKELYKKYIDIKKILEDTYYDAVTRTCPWYTNHGKKHIESIIKTASNMIEPQYVQFNELDFYIFLSSIIWHDVGMVFSRSNHEKKVNEEMKKFSSILGKDFLIMATINKIVKAHTGSYRFELLETAENIEYNGKTYQVNVRALAAMLRLADEISEDYNRIDKKLLDEGIVPKENVIYWEFADAVKQSYPDPKYSCIELKINIEKDKILKKYYYNDNKIPHDGSEIQLFDFILWRIDKINKERIMCSPEIRQYCTLSGLKIIIAIVDGYDELKSDEIILDEKYLVGSQSNFVDAFYEKQAEWSKENIEQIIIEEGKENEE